MTMKDDDYVGGGYIVLARKLENESSTFKYCRNNDERWMFIKCLLRANFQDVVVNGIELKRGQFLTSIDSFAKETETSSWKVRMFWAFFKQLGFLTSRTTNKYTIVTILNYGRYQKIENYLMKKPQAKPQTNHKQTTTDKEYKEGKEIINITHFEQIWSKYPNKVSRQKAQEKFIASVKTEEDFDLINKALETYKKHLELNAWKKVQDGKTWFNDKEWRSWIDYEESQPKGKGWL